MIVYAKLVIVRAKLVIVYAYKCCNIRIYRGSKTIKQENKYIKQYIKQENNRSVYYILRLLLDLKENNNLRLVTLKAYPIEGVFNHK